MAEYQLPDLTVDDLQKMIIRQAMEIEQYRKGLTDLVQSNQALQAQVGELSARVIAHEGPAAELESAASSGNGEAGGAETDAGPEPGPDPRTVPD